MSSSVIAANRDPVYDEAMAGRWAALAAAVALTATAGCDHWFPPEDAALFCRGRPEWYVDTTFRKVKLVARSNDLFVHLTADRGADAALDDRDFPAVTAPFQNVVAAIAVDDGTVEWMREMEFQGSEGVLAMSPDGRLFSAEAAVGGTGMVSRLDPDDGQIMRSSPAPFERPTALAASDAMAVVAGNGTLSALDAGSGELLWQNDTISGVTSIAITSDGNVAVAQTLEGSGIHLSVLDGGTGELLWNHGPRSVGLEVASLPGGDVALVHRDGNGGPLFLIRFGADGSIKWSRRLGYPSAVLDLLVLADGDLLLLGNGREFADATVAEQCHYVARLSADDGLTRDVRSICFCEYAATATANDTGREFVHIDLPRGPAPIALFDPGDLMSATP